MRDALLLTLLLASLPVCVLRPHVGIYLWYWVAFMNPHRLTWGVAYSFPVAQSVALATALGMGLRQHTWRLPRQRESYLLVVLALIFTLNTVVAMFPDRAWVKWEEVSKVLFMTFLTIALITEREKLRWMLIVVVGSIGFFGLKGTVWGIATAGQYRLYGPPESAVGDNNALSMAMNMVVPLALFLARTEPDRRVRGAFWALAACMAFGVLLTYSRGGFLGLAVVAMALVWKMKRRALAGGAMVLGLIALASFMPEKWYDRIGSIGEYERDESAMSRLQTWDFAWELAQERPLTGGGFHAFRANPSDYDAHSVYFGMLAEQGWIGFALFLVIIGVLYRNSRFMERRAGGAGDGAWYAHLGSMMQVSLAAYLVSGAFLNLHYFDLFYWLFAVSVIGRALVRHALTEAERAVPVELETGDLGAAVR